MMLQRAASNAYSWWWASHIRTKQSKWLEQNLQDMEEKVHTTLKLIEEDGDSFAKRAEMYYKKRPELINFVEESYRAYRALAERYDHISTELQNANNTLASVFPDQVQFSMDDDDDDSPRRPPEMMRPDVPKVPKAPTKDLKSILSSGAKKLRQQKKPKKKAFQIPVTTSKSGLSKQEGVQKIDKLQKDILSLQTAKEFVKSSYEGGLAKYWEIEKQINDLQGEVSVLQDEFSETLVIEDDEARSLMTATALRSCEETLIVLQEKQNKSAEAAKLEQKRIEEARQRFESLKKEILPGQAGDGEPSRVSLEDRHGRETQELVLLEEKIKEQFQISLNSSMTVTEMAEKIDELVNKVISLETAVASQDGLIARLKGETDHLHTLIKVLQSDKTGLAKGYGNVEAKMKEMERKFNGVEDLTRRVKEQSINLHTHFTEAQCNLEHLSEKVQCVKSDDEPEVVSLSKEGGYLNEAKRLVGLKVDGYDHSAGDKDSKRKTSNSEPERTQEKQKVSHSSGKVNESLAEAESSAKTKAKESKGSKVEEDEPTVADNSTKLKTNDSGKQDKKQKASSGSSMKKNDSFPVTRSLEVPQQQREAPTSSNDPAKVLSRTIEPVIAAPATSSEQQTGPIPREICNESNQVKSQQKEIGAVQPSISTPAMNVQEKSAPKKLTDMPEPHLQHTEVNEDSPQQILSGSSSQTEAEKQEMEQEEPNWRELFLKGMEEREKTLLSEYTTTLRNYKDVKKKLHEVEKKTETTVQLRELKTANAMKDEEIRSLREKLSHLQTVLGHNKEHKSSDSLNVRDRGPVSSEKDSFTASQRKEPDVDEDEDEDDLNVMMVDQSEPISEIEEKLRMDIDQLLEENLDFWLRFSAALNQIQKYETSVEDLRSEISKLEEKAKKTEGSSHRSKPVNLKSDLKPLYKHLSEIQNELAVWMEKCGMLKEEQQSRLSSLCNIQEEITKAVKSSAEDEDFRFTSYQAAKFQGEVLNMKQENHKVADELQAGLDHITVLQIDVDRTLTRLNEEFEFSVSKSQQNPQLNHSASRARVPLRSFIFGVKPKKHRPSIFTCMTPAMHRKYNGLRVGF